MARPELCGKIKAMTDAFFAEGGQELQFNCLDSATLREAKERPETHPDLMVRVAGFNALFARLSEAEQDELIRRVEATERGT
jgi:formate C-acetyltransferase